MATGITGNGDVRGEFVDMEGERYYAIRNVDKMAPFFISIVSNADHWLFISSTGGLTAGRVSPDTALFPYVTVDKIHESTPHTGSKTLLRVNRGGLTLNWEPFNRECEGRYATSRHLYKSRLGNKLCFEEVNHDLNLTFRYSWATSDRYGFIRRCELENQGDEAVDIELVDGLQNILPAGTPRFAQTNSSNLVDAYKWAELDEDSGLAFFLLYSGITDRAEPFESLKANTVFSLGLDERRVLLSSEQLDSFRSGAALQQESHKRGIRGAYLVNAAVRLAPHASQRWQIVADIERSQARVVALCQELADPAGVADAIPVSIEQGSDELARIVAGGDGFQATGEEAVSDHHYGNVLFNILRGGVFDDQYTVASKDFAGSVREFNRDVYRRNSASIDALPERLKFTDLLSFATEQADAQLQRLCYEYLPITFGRRHGDPSRPWNQFAIRLKDASGKRRLYYEGNWRDIFQNWEALTFSYPEFAENIIAKFVNASTVDGYNPYRITRDGIDWEVQRQDDPWSYIGYWGDHQIIYLQKLLELSKKFHPARLGELLHEPIFCYANVPYRIRPFEALLEDPKKTVDYDHELAARIEQRVARMGADGKLVLDANGDVYQVGLLEKLLVPLLGKLGNLVIDGGIWLNTQRPEWNDANNALVGHGLSMVTLYYLRRYVRLLQELLTAESGTVQLSAEVDRWLAETAIALAHVRPLLGSGPIGPAQRFDSLRQLGEAASRYRQAVYEQGAFSGRVIRSLETVVSMLEDALAAIDHSIGTNQREDGLYHAYNVLDLQHESVGVDNLYPMLEGQVAVLSAGAIAPGKAVEMLEALFDSNLYRADQHTFMLYPDRQLPGFLARNRIPAAGAEAIPLLRRMIDAKDERIVVRDAAGCYRFSAEFRNVEDLDAELDAVAADYGSELDAARGPLLALYEQVFNHRMFTGRSGGMFGFEGLGCIYWHMVSKLLLAAQENFFAAAKRGADQEVRRQLGRLYYRVREGLCFNKSPAEYGAFPGDPYSHTPGHAGAQQPGMTGQVKEGVLLRFGELGVQVEGGAASFDPGLLRSCEFGLESRPFRYLDVDGKWQELAVPASGLAFTWCQVPVVYVLGDDQDVGVTITRDDGSSSTQPGLALTAEASACLFLRSGHIRRIDVTVAAGMLFAV